MQNIQRQNVFFFIIENETECYGMYLTRQAILWQKDIAFYILVERMTRHFQRPADSRVFQENTVSPKFSYK